MTKRYSCTGEFVRKGVEVSAPPEGDSKYNESKPKSSPDRRIGAQISSGIAEAQTASKASLVDAPEQHGRQFT
jgi:hypothetical protein